MVCDCQCDYGQPLTLECPRIHLYHMAKLYICSRTCLKIKGYLPIIWTIYKVDLLSFKNKIKLPELKISPTIFDETWNGAVFSDFLTLTLFDLNQWLWRCDTKGLVYQLACDTPIGSVMSESLVIRSPWSSWGCGGDHGDQTTGLSDMTDPIGVPRSHASWYTKPLDWPRHVGQIRSYRSL